MLDDVFAEMLKGYAARKYGATEITKIKALFANPDKPIAVVHSFHEAAAKSPCYSIQLGSENEAKERAHLEDFESDIQEEITDEEELEQLIKIDNLIPTAYDEITGKVSVSDSADMSLIHPGYIYVDGDELDFEVKKGISNVPGNKFFFIEKRQTPNIVDPGLIKTFLDYTQHEEKGDVSAVNILIGCHSKEALITKYLYVILKYIMKSRKRDLIQRAFTVSSFQGSDFTRDLRYEGDMVFTRFFTMTGQVEDSWRSADVPLIDNVVIDATPIDCADEDES